LRDNPFFNNVRGTRAALGVADADQIGDFDGISLPAEASIAEEPGARKPHAELCGGSRVTGCPTAMAAFQAVEEYLSISKEYSVKPQRRE
jgi:hypothetical protein